MTQPTRFYLHGLPGSTAELNFALPKWRKNTNIQPLDRLSAAATHKSALESMASQLANYESVHLIGFSLGAMSAMKLAARMPETVLKLDLIAPVAPLELGDYLKDMAGKPIFEAAMKPGGGLGRLIAAQRTLARFSMRAVIKAMFNGAADADKVLLNDPAMQTMLRDVLRRSLIEQPYAYKSELRTFVAPWADMLPRVRCKTVIWQGDADTWAPPALADALCEALPDAELEVLAGLSHYSGLKAALERIAV
jgi:pimeloyl-ACP methyl ester carboxylesterase